MATVESSTHETHMPLARSGLHPWQWAQVVLAGFAMVATLPGRTHGLGLVTEPLLHDLQVNRLTYAGINLWATLLGAAFCVPCGWLLDRVPARVVLLSVTLGLASTVLTMSWASIGWGLWLVPGLFLLILLTRGLGQSALSVISLAIMGKAAGQRSGFAVGVYSLVTALGFMASFGLIKKVVEIWDPGWQPLWAGIGLGVAGLGLVAFPLLRVPQQPEIPPAHAEEAPRAQSPRFPEGSLTLGEALGTAAFWVFALGTSLYGMVAAGISLFNQAILRERGFDRSVFLTIATLSPLVGLAGNLATGWLMSYFRPGQLLALALMLLTFALFAFPWVQSLAQVYAYAVILGLAGGMVTVIFFGAWVRTFGTLHLGKIQGAAQLLTVLASALGPLILASSERLTGSYLPFFQYLALVSAGLALCAWWVPMPQLQNNQSQLAPTRCSSSRNHSP